MSCYDNKLESLDLSKNTVLEGLSCYDNELTSLDLSKNTVLEGLSCYDNKLESLDLSKNTDLYNLDCSNNKLTSLDLSQNTKLRVLRYSNNPLISLDIRGMREDLPQLRLNDTTLQTLIVHQNIKNKQGIIDFKTTRGDGLMISTYSAAVGSTNYTLICGDYTPGPRTQSEGTCND